MAVVEFERGLLAGVLAGGEGRAAADAFDQAKRKLLQLAVRDVIGGKLD
ncbi:hypothetical protein M2322_000459 [Rhodoblastus acidophilus]|nr:hypothetical protein [Rhodoblastus acidophilus]